MGKKFRMFGAFEKVEAQEDGTLIVSGIASSETVDGAGETVKADAMKAAIPDYMKFGAVREMHQPIAAGTALSIGVDDAGITRFEAHVVDASSVAKVSAGVLKGFSIGGSVTSRDPLNKKIIDGLKLTEISLVDVPCNPDAVFAIAKFENPEESEMDTPETTITDPTPEPEPIKKGMWSVQDFAGILMNIGWMAQDAKWESENEGDASPVPSKLAAWLAAGAEIFKEMAAEEVAELLATLKPKDGVEAIAMAAGAGDLAKAGAKFSAASKASLDAAHQEATDLHKAMGDCLGKMAGLWNDGDDTDKAAITEAITKASGLTEELAKVQAEKDALQKSLDAISEDLKKSKDALDVAETKLKEKGVSKVVPVEKGAESKSLNGVADAPDPSDPLAVMKAAQAQPLNLIYNRPAIQG